MKTITIALVLVTVFYTTGYTQCVYYEDSPPVGWTGYPSPVSYSYFVNFPSSFQAAVNAAAGIWTGAGALVSIQNDQTSPNDISVGDLGFSQTQPFLLAFSVLAYNSAHTRITGVTTEVNVDTNVYWFTDPNNDAIPDTCYDLETVILHEFGHWFDLADSEYTCSTSIMYLPIPIGTRKGLSLDDINAVYAIYDNLGVGGGTAPTPPGNFTVSIEGQNVVLDWAQYYDQSASGLYILKNGSVLSPPDNVIGQTSYTDVSAANSLPITYQLEATNQYGASYSTAITVSAAPSTISSNTTWSGTIYVNNNVTIDSGSTLTISQGTNVVFAAGNNYSLSSNGQLNVQQATFNSNSSSPSAGDWGSIVLNGSGADGSVIDYSNIDYGTQVDITNTSNVTIENCFITNNSGHGIYFYNSSGSALNNAIANTNVNHGIYVLSSTVTCDGNVIYKTNQNQQGAGIQYSESSGYIWRNDVDYYNWGIAAIWGSSPLWENVDSSGGRNNRITHCQIGVMVYQNSYPDIGEPYPTYGTSSIYDNDVDVALNTWYSTVSNLDASGNYWNGGNPSNAIFQTGPGSSIYVDPYVSTDFWSGFPIPSAQSRVKETVKPPIVASATPGNSPNATNNFKTRAGTSFDSLSIGIKYLEKRRHKEAADFFMSYLGRHPQAEAGYVYLYSCADSTTRPDIIKYFKSLPSQAAREDKLLLSNLYLRQGDIWDAKLVNDGIMDSNPNTALAEKAELNNFYIALFDENDANQASSILNDVVQKASLSTPMEISDAEHALKMYVDPNSGRMPNMSSQQTGLSNEPQANGLVQNYPNPFNPTTLISYNLRAAGNVTLNVYDVLGRKVMTLVSGYQSVGIHSAEFNGDNLASGVYFYRLTAPGISQIKKMILLK